MGAATPNLFVCSCERSMPLDPQAIGRGCAGKITQAEADEHLANATERITKMVDEGFPKGGPGGPGKGGERPEPPADGSAPAEGETPTFGGGTGGD